MELQDLEKTVTGQITGSFSEPERLAMEGIQALENFTVKLAVETFGGVDICVILPGVYIGNNVVVAAGA